MGSPQNFPYLKIMKISCKNKDTRDDGPEWLSTMIDNYEKHYGVRLSIPRWSDIINKYVSSIKHNG